VRWRLLIRTDSGGGTHEFPELAHPPRAAARLLRGFTITGDAQQAIHD